MFRVKQGVFYSKYYSKKSVAFWLKNLVNLVLLERLIFTKIMLKMVFLRAKFRASPANAGKRKTAYIVASNT